MKIIVISTEHFCSNETVAVCSLFEAGLQIFHLRKPKSTIEEMRDFIIKIPVEFHGRVVLHDHFSLIREFELKGIHINKRNPSVEMQHATFLQHKSKSCHSLEEIKNISQFDYVFLSPIFDSISKSGYSKAFSHEELLQAKNAGIISEKVIALGGIMPENISKIVNYGFGGIAILGGLWADFEASGDIQSLLQRFENFVKAKNISSLHN
ncbi:MAG: thiamine phosphate synthase [Bacteroidales bacterium]|jgi:thiamine-phosphate pyrophosphorylase|nr:thiamine phosphate synthase [Bacteroidales bacterium]